jgi:hypothetical protein
MLTNVLVEEFEKKHAGERAGLDRESVDHWVEKQKRNIRKLPNPSIPPEVENLPNQSEDAIKNPVTPPPIVKKKAITVAAPKKLSSSVVTKENNLDVLPTPEILEEVVTAPTEGEIPIFIPVVVVTGLPLSGKTTASTVLADCLSLPLLKLDDVIEWGLELSKMSPPVNPGPIPNIFEELQRQQDLQITQRGKAEKV